MRTLAALVPLRLLLHLAMGVALAVLLAQCAGADSAALGDPPDAALHPGRAAPPTPGPTAVVDPRPELDLGAVMRRVHFAYRARDQGHEGGHSTYEVATTGDGRFEVKPYHWVAGEPHDHRAAPAPTSAAEPLDPLDMSAAPDQRVGAGRVPERALTGAPARFETVSVARGGVELTAPPVESVSAADASLVIDRGVVVEHLRNHEQGVDQSWSFAERPPGAGALVVEVEVTGLPHVATTPAGQHFVDPESGLGVVYGLATFIDARGERTAIVPRWAAGRLVIEVPAAVVASAAFPAEIDPTIGPEFGVGTPVAAPSAVSHNPAVAYDSGNSRYLVVWADVRTGTARMMGARVTTTGTVLDAAGFTIGTAEGNPYNDVAFDGTNFLVVWGSSSVYAQRVSTAGANVGSQVTITTTAYDSSVAWNGSTYLVVFRYNGIQGQRVSTTGTLTGAAFTVSSDTSAIRADVAALGTNFLVAFYASQAARAQRVDTNGNLTGSAISVIPNPVVGCGACEVKVAASSSNWLVAATRGASNELAVAPVSSAGAVGTVTAVNAGVYCIDHDLTFGGSNYYAAWWGGATCAARASPPPASARTATVWSSSRGSSRTPPSAWRRGRAST